ncbi:MAG TPA: hypothetical protein VK400_17635 [Pyrinomonadaceae bacterium]|nr:hypothetical protein [Pyrinomonadaceae bacterium]
MKKLPFFLALSCLLVINSFAQTRERRVFDNFDTMSGVRIVVPPAPQQQRQPPQPAPQNAPRKLVRKTGQQTGVGSVQDGLGLQNVSHPRQQQPSVNKLSMSAGNSLGGFTTGDVLIDSYIVESSIRYNIDPLLI